MSAAPKPMVFVKSVRLGEFVVSELLGLIKRELEREQKPALEKEWRQLRNVFNAFLLSEREVEIRVVPDEEDKEE